MFGRRKLLREGVAAQAVVVSSELRIPAGRKSGRWLIQLAVPFPDGTTGSASCKIDERRIPVPSPGALVPVRYDPNNHAKVVVDGPALDARRAARLQAAAQRDAARVQEALDAVRERNGDTPTG
ncbi:hypothetical protein ABZS66_52935 [Dactylosporangium sp. NPDC005572]|uniref:hypothetical protein n=1 Tax=Dactylosporangium sp. NPDC005572 TaxID=3156889 RepID=UPI0033AF44DD